MGKVRGGGGLTRPHILIRRLGLADGLAGGVVAKALIRARIGRRGAVSQAREASRRVVGIAGDDAVAAGEGGPAVQRAIADRDARLLGSAI